MKLKGKINKKSIKKILKTTFQIGKAIRLTKLSDDVFEGKHPNNIQEGYTRRGIMIVPPTIGERFWLQNFSTSPVTKIINKHKFKTMYSTYKIEYL